MRTKQLHPLQLAFAVSAVSLALAFGCNRAPSSASSEIDNRNACISNLRQLDGAKEVAATQMGLTNGQAIPLDLLIANGGWPLHCPSGATYEISVVGHPPRCSIPGHLLPGTDGKLEGVKLEGPIIETH